MMGNRSIIEGVVLNNRSHHIKHLLIRDFVGVFVALLFTLELLENPNLLYCLELAHLEILFK